MLHWLLLCCLKVNGVALWAAGEGEACESHRKPDLHFGKCTLLPREGFAYRLQSILDSELSLLCQTLQSFTDSLPHVFVFFTAHNTRARQKNVRIHMEKPYNWWNKIIMPRLLQILPHTAQQHVRQIASPWSRSMFQGWLSPQWAHSSLFFCWSRYSWGMIGLQQISGLFQRQPPSSKDTSNTACQQLPSS